LLLGTVSLAFAQCLFWIVGAWLGWLLCCWLTPAWLVTALTAGAVINVVALILFAARRRTWGQPVMAVAQLANLLFSLFAWLTVSPAWLLFSSVPSLATLILVALEQRQRRRAADQPEAR
jgi:uncharacterized membrane protein